MSLKSRYQCSAGIQSSSTFADNLMIFADRILSRKLRKPVLHAFLLFAPGLKHRLKYAVGALAMMRYTNSRFTYLLTYLKLS